MRVLASALLALEVSGSGAAFWASRRAAFLLLCGFWLSAADTLRLCSKYFGRAAGGGQNVPTAAQQGAAPDRLQLRLSLVPRYSLRFRRRVSLVVGLQRLLFLVCKAFGLLAAIFWAVFADFGVGDVLLSAFLAGFSITFWFSGAPAFQHRRGFLGFGSRRFVQCRPTRRCTRPPTASFPSLVPRSGLCASGGG
ncbi:MAG: hypothetical protein WKF71_04330 [Pyrinomonadaceae bacterium]